MTDSDLAARAAAASSERGEIDEETLFRLLRAQRNQMVLEKVSPIVAGTIMNYLSMQLDKIGVKRKHRKTLLQGLVVGFGMGYEYGISDPLTPDDILRLKTAIAEGSG